MRKTTRGKGLAGGTAVAAVIAGLALLQSLGLAAFPSCQGAGSGWCGGSAGRRCGGHRGPVSPMEGDPGR